MHAYAARLCKASTGSAATLVTLFSLLVAASGVVLVVEASLTERLALKVVSPKNSDDKTAELLASLSLSTSSIRQGFHSVPYTDVLRHMYRDDPFLVQRATVFRNLMFGGTLLHLAVISNKTQTAKLLLSRGAEVDVTCTLEGMDSYKLVTPLHLASLYGSDASVHVLLEHGASTDAEAMPDALLPIHLAADKGRTQIVKRLLGAGSKMVSPSGDMASHPLHLAAASDATRVVHALVAAGADINAGNKADAATPLHIAAQANAKNAVKALLGLGADIARQDNEGLTAADVAEEEGNTAILKMLREAVSTPRTKEDL